MNTNSEAGMFMKVTNANSDFKCMHDDANEAWDCPHGQWIIEK